MIERSSVFKISPCSVADETCFCITLFLSPHMSHAVIKRHQTEWSLSQHSFIPNKYLWKLSLLLNISCKRLLYSSCLIDLLPFLFNMMRKILNSIEPKSSPSIKIRSSYNYPYCLLSVWEFTQSNEILISFLFTSRWNPAWLMKELELNRYLQNFVTGWNCKIMWLCLRHVLNLT